MVLPTGTSTRPSTSTNQCVNMRRNSGTSAADQLHREKSHDDRRNPVLLLLLAGTNHYCRGGLL